MLNRSLYLIGALSAILVAWVVISKDEKKPVKKETTWGFYQIHWGIERFEAGIKKQIDQLGASPNYVLFFRDMHPKRGFPTPAANACKKYGATPVISQELWLWRERHASPSNWLENINSGKTDDYWREWAKNAKAFEADVILRFGFEMNGDWFSWGQQPEAFVAAWRRVYSIVRNDEGAHNVQFMFSPNVEWDETRKLTAIEHYYPGDEFVELLGLDGYNFGDSHSKSHRWQTYHEIFEKSIKNMGQWKKPLILAEIGCADDPRKAQWMKEFLDAVKADSRVEGFIYFNHFDPNKGEPNWLLNSDPETLQVFKKAMQNHQP